MTDSTKLIQIVRQGMDVVIHRSWRDQARFVKTTGLSMPQFGILMQLHYRHQCGVSDISARMDVSPAAASQLIDKLVHSGLLERTEDPHDRRAKNIRLSQKGQELISSSIAARQRWVEMMIENLSLEERQKMAAAMSILIKSLQDVDESKYTEEK